MKLNSSNKFQQHRRLIILVLIVIAVFCVPIVGAIRDEITIKTANPTMVKLAQASGMSRKGELLFLRTNPQLVTSSQMESDCSANTAANNSDGFIEQGCYNPPTNQIYILKMSSDLYEVEVSTAAYELLHPIYISIYKSGQGSTLDKSIEANFQSNEDSFLDSQVANFAKTEPGDRDLELFSLLATNYSSISSDLANYYQPYFRDITMSVAANNQVTALFNGYVSQLNQLNGTLNTDNNYINEALNNANTAYADSVSWANVGNAYEDDYNYNIYTQDFNTYNQDITDYNNTVDQYNQVLQNYDVLVNEYNGQQFSQANTVQSQQQQSQ